jgi:hypothetical protein
LTAPLSSALTAAGTQSASAATTAPASSKCFVLVMVAFPWIPSEHPILAHGKTQGAGSGVSL